MPISENMMNKFRKIMGTIEDTQPEATTEETATKPIEKEEEEWVWVDGFKGMDKNMQCYGGFQYEVGKRYDMEEGATVEACSGGFHMCLNLRDVFDYVRIGENNRFFQVRALVRKSDWNEYYVGMANKLAAKSIEIVRELTADEILKSYGGDEWNEKYKQMALSAGTKTAINTMMIDELTELGYSLPFAKWLVDNGKNTIAKAVGSQTDLSMDMKCLMIMYG